jgi:hypothetical protein
MENKECVKLRSVYDQIALLGKLQVALALNLADQIDLTDTEGDKDGIDLRFDDMFTIGVETVFGDVETIFAEDTLYVDTKRARALFYVLVCFDQESSKSEIVGWTTVTHVMQSPITMGDDKSPMKAYAVPASKLRPLNELKARMNLTSQQDGGSNDEYSD